MWLLADSRQVLAYLFTALYDSAHCTCYGNHWMLIFCFLWLRFWIFKNANFSVCVNTFSIPTHVVGIVITLLWYYNRIYNNVRRVLCITSQNYYRLEQLYAYQDGNDILSSLDIKQVVNAIRCQMITLAFYTQMERPILMNRSIFLTIWLKNCWKANEKS